MPERNQEPMLIIKNFDQFLDALNLCETGIYTYDEIIESVPLDAEEVTAYAAKSSETSNLQNIMARKHFSVSLVNLAPEESISINENLSNSWIKCIQGELSLGNSKTIENQTDTQLLVDQTMKFTHQQAITNKGEYQSKGLLITHQE